MIRRNAQKGIQIARRGYLSFIEKGNIGVVNYIQTGTLLRITEAGFKIDAPNSACNWLMLLGQHSYWLRAGIYLKAHLRVTGLEKSGFYLSSLINFDFR